MSDDEEVNIEFDVDDKVTPKLTRMERAVGRLGKAVDNASGRFMGMASQMGMMMGFFTLGPAIQGAKNYINHIDKIGKLTGLASERAAGISNALQGAGVDGAEVENIFNKLGKAGTKMTEGQKSLAKLAKGYGVELKGGPEKSLIAMSAAIEKGKLGTVGISRVLGVSTEQAAKLRDALAKGPEEVRKSFDELSKKNAVFSNDTVGGVAAWNDAMTRVGLAWNRMAASVLVRLAPGLEKLAAHMESAIDRWAAGATRFGTFLEKHMEKIIAMAKTYAKIMLVNTVSQKLTGVGAVTNIGRVAGGLSRGGSKIWSGIRALGGAVDIGAGRGAMILIGEMVKGFFKIRPIITAFAKFAPIGGVIALAAGAAKALGENFNGIADKLKKTFGGIFETLSRIGSKLAELFGGDGPIGRLLGGVGYAFLEVVNKIGEVMGFILKMVEKIVDLIPDIFKGDATTNVFARRKYGEDQVAYYERRQRRKGLAVDQKVIADIRAKAMAGYYDDAKVQRPAELPKPKVPTKGAEGPQVYQDFRGSRFDIKQAFSDGYDPDRVAVAFANDLASLGERKLQSGFSPMFAVR